MLTCQRKLFGIDPEVRYLNCAYMSPILREAEEAGIAGLHMKTNPQLIRTEHFFEDAEIIRRFFAEIILSPEAARIAVLPSASYGIAAAAQNIPVRPGQNIVMAGGQFPSNVYSWLRLAKEKNLEIRFVDRDLNSPIPEEDWNNKIAEAIDKNTVIVALPVVHWSDGTVFDLPRFAEKVHVNDGYLIADGTQSVGVKPFEIQKSGVDVLVCAAYKWLMGPYGSALAWYGPRFDEGVPIEEVWINREDSDNFAGLVNYNENYRPKAGRFDAGGRSNFIAQAMLKVGLQQILEWSVPDIYNYCRKITDTFFERTAEYGFVLPQEKYRSAHLFGLRFPKNYRKDRLENELQKRKISVSFRGEVMRVSPYLYNTKADLQELTDALIKAL